MKKRILSITVALMMVLALLPFGALAAEGEDYDLSAYADDIKEIMNGLEGTVYGTFADLDQDDLPELIMTGHIGANQSLFVRSIGSDLNWHTYLDCDRQFADVSIVEYPDGTRGLMVAACSGFDSDHYAGQDDEGRKYYWRNDGLQLYQAVDGKIQMVTSVNTNGLDSEPDKDGNIYYFMDDRSFSINSRLCTEAEYDNWYATYADPAEWLISLSPWEYHGGLTGQELLNLVQTGFYDVPADQYYAEPVVWALENGITNGTGDFQFSPEAPCTRGQVVTFLWRASGSPEPKSANNPFVDVKAGDYFYTAVLWAVEQGVTNGTSSTTFSPESPCTRAHVVTFLWRSHNKPAADTANPFKDVPAGEYYTDAVLWAVKNEITNGMDATHFGPDKTCIRGQIVTFLYRDLAK